MMANDETDYEKLRNAKIAKNKEVMRGLGLPVAVLATTTFKRPQDKR